MTSFFRLRTILSRAWRNASSAPSLLVPGVAISITALFENSFFSKITENFSPDFSSLKPQFSSILFLLILILATSTLKTIIESQLYLSIAAKTLNRPALLSKIRRLRSVFRYISIEIAFWFILFLALLPFAIISLFNDSGSFSEFITFVHFLALCFFGIIFILSSLVKRLFFGYSILSPLGFRSALSLSVKIFVRYQRFSIFFFLVVSIILSLFTFLQNLVMLQGAFLYKYMNALVIETGTYTAVLLLGTFIAIFFEALWVQYFLVLTNKQSEEAAPLVVIQEEVSEIPPL